MEGRGRGVLKPVRRSAAALPACVFSLVWFVVWCGTFFLVFDGSERWRSLCLLPDLAHRETGRIHHLSISRIDQLYSSSNRGDELDPSGNTRCTESTWILQFSDQASSESSVQRSHVRRGSAMAAVKNVKIPTTRCWWWPGTA
jgi:hypothetical protein